MHIISNFESYSNKLNDFILSKYIDTYNSILIIF